MSLPLQSSSSSASPRALRIGIFSGQRCIEERIHRPGKPVTIGQTLDNDLVVPSGDVPRQHRLFEHREGIWMLRTTPVIGGRISIDGKVRQLGRDSGPDTQRTPEPGSIPLGPDGRGRLDVGKLRILFQTVALPDRRRHLPAAFGGGGLLAGLSGFLGTRWLVALALSALFQLVPLSWVMLSDWPAPETLQTVPDWYAEDTVEVQPVSEEEVEPEAEPEDSVPGAVADAPLSPRALTPEPQKRASHDEKDPRSRRDAERDSDTRASRAKGKRLVTQVFGVKESDQSIGAAIANDIVADDSALAALTGLDPTDIGKPGEEVALNLGDGGSPDAELHSRKCSPCLPSARHHDLIRDVEPTRRKKIKLITREDIKVPPTLPHKPASSIEAVFTRKRKQIENCYKRTIQKHGAQSGKLVVSVTIGTDRKVLKVQVSHDSVGKGLGKCVQAKIERWRFPSIEKPITVAKRWVFN